jgi:hypothetical protein
MCIRFGRSGGPVPVSGCEASGHGETFKRYQVPIDVSEVSCHDEIVSVKSKKQGIRASTSQPKDAVPGDETVRVQQYFISGTKVTSIDFGAGFKIVLGWRTVSREASVTFKQNCLI